MDPFDFFFAPQPLGPSQFLYITWLVCSDPPGMRSAEADRVIHPSLTGVWPLYPTSVAYVTG